MSSAPNRVAVIAIHGVGYHASGVSAEAVTDLLEGVRTDEKDANSKHRYGSFTPEEVQIALPPPIKNQKTPRPFNWKPSAFEERRGKMEDLSKLSSWRTYRLKASPEHDALDIATEHMDTQMEDYVGDPDQNSYTTWRREGHRSGDDPASTKFVDVYDMHWADLARPSNSFLRFLFSFYQLLLHLVSLGRTALDHAAYENFGELDWFLYLRFYTYANRLLTLFILQLTAIVFGVAISPLPLLLEDPTERAIIAGLFVAIAGLALVLWRGQASNSPFGLKSPWLFVPLVMALSAAIMYLLSKYQDAAPAVLFVEWWVLGAGVCILIALQYDKVRNGSKEVAIVLIVLTTVLLIIILICKQSLSISTLRTASFYLVQYVFLALRTLWILFFLFAFLAFLMELVCRFRLSRNCDTEEKHNLRARARMAARTARFAIAVPSLLILLLAVFAGSATYKYLSKWEGLYQGVDAGKMPPLLDNHFANSFFAINADDTEKLLDLIEKKLHKPNSGCGANAPCMPQPKELPGKNASSAAGDKTSTPSQPPNSTVVSNDKASEPVSNKDATEQMGTTKASKDTCIAVTPAKAKANEKPNRFLEGIVYQSAPVGMLPSAILATVGLLILVLLVLPSVWFEIFPERSKPNGPSRRLGEWLSGGYRQFRWTIALLWLAAFAVPLGLMAYYAAIFRPSVNGESFLFFLYSRPSMVSAANLVISWGGILAGSGMVVLGLVVKNFSAVLDTILDVDTYLRTSPQEATPRAQIVERYVALLGHLHSRVNADGTSYYQRVIIVAHSLGSNITADMLRFLNKVTENKVYAPLYQNYVSFAFAGKRQGTLPVIFFSMGCPLRQLLNRFFPHLYRWIREAPEDSGVAVSPTEKAGNTLGPKDTPPIADLRVAKWLNFYRSGDYVGRSIWTNDVVTRTRDKDDNAGAYPVPKDWDSTGVTDKIKFAGLPDTNRDGDTEASAGRIEACIGLGAHTHYWDRTAPDVGNQLDKMIAD